MTKMIHSLWAYIALIILIFAVFNAINGLLKKKEYTAKDLRLALFALITSHIQVIIGLIAYYTSNFYSSMRGLVEQEGGMGNLMKTADLRKPLIEHPIAVIIAIVLITVGFSVHKKKTTDKAKFKTVAIYYSIALILILGVIPWKLWFS